MYGDTMTDAEPLVEADTLETHIENTREQNAEAVGFLTSRNINAFEYSSRTDSDVSAHCMATIGLSNRMRVGDPPGPIAINGTINILSRVSCPLSENAFVEVRM